MMTIRLATDALRLYPFGEASNGTFGKTSKGQAGWEMSVVGGGPVAS